MRPPILGFDPENVDDCLRVAWADRTVIATLPGGILGPAMEAEQEVESAQQDEQRILFENVVWLDDYRR